MSLIKSQVTLCLVFILKECICTSFVHELHIQILSVMKWQPLFACCFIFACCELAGSSVEFEAEVNRIDKSLPFEVETEDISAHEDSPRPYLYTVCDKRFTRKQYLNAHRHKRIRSVENVYSCSECEKSFSSQSGLSYHKNIHTDKYKCCLLYTSPSPRDS